MLLPKTIQVLIPKFLVDSNISLDEFVSVNNRIKEYDDIKEEIKNSNDKQKLDDFLKV